AQYEWQGRVQLRAFVCQRIRAISPQGQLVWIGHDAGQRRTEVIAAVKKAGSSSHGRCAAPGWTVTVAFGNSRAPAAAVSGVGSAPGSPAYTSTGAASGRLARGWRPG